MMPSFITPHCISAWIAFPKGEETLYLLLKRSGVYLHGTWQMVSGGIQDGETAPEAAWREIFEETGVIPDSFYSADTVETFYMASRDKITFVPVFLGLVRDLPEVTLSPHEHSEYQWVTYKEAMPLLSFAEQRRVLTHIHQEFILKEPPAIHRIQEQSCGIAF